jgi:hypothetical protein
MALSTASTHRRSSPIARGHAPGSSSRRAARSSAAPSRSSSVSPAWRLRDGRRSESPLTRAAGPDDYMVLDEMFTGPRNKRSYDVPGSSSSETAT